MLEAVGRDKHGADLRPGEVADDVESLEILAETFELGDRNHVEEPVVISAVHGRGNGVYIHFLAQCEAAALEGDLVGVDLDAEPAVAMQAQQRIREAAGHEIAERRADARLFQLDGHARVQLRTQVRADQHPVLLQHLLVRTPLLELDALALKDLQAQESSAERPAHADQVLGLRLRTGGRDGGVVATGGRKGDGEPVARRLQIQAQVLVAELLGRRRHTLPELLHLREIQFRRHAELDGKRLGARQHGVQLPRHAQHGLAAEVLQREIDQVEIDPLQQQAGDRGDAFLGFGLEPQRFFEGAETRPFEKLPDRFDAAQVREGLRHPRGCAGGC